MFSQPNVCDRTSIIRRTTIFTQPQHLNKMKSLNIKTQNNSFQFTVNKRQVSKKNKTLKSSILYDKVELSAHQSVSLYKDLLYSDPKTFELDFIENAYLNDELIVKNQLKKLNNSELELSVIVLKKKETQENIICKATFGYTFKRAS